MYNNTYYSKKQTCYPETFKCLMAEAKSVPLRLRNCINTCFPVMKVSQEVMFQLLLMCQIYIHVHNYTCVHDRV